MTPAALLAFPIAAEVPVTVDPRLLHLKQIVINGVAAANSKRTTHRRLTICLPLQPDGQSIESYCSGGGRLWRSSLLQQSTSGSRRCGG